MSKNTEQEAQDLIVLEFIKDNDKITLIETTLVKAILKEAVEFDSHNTIVPRKLKKGVYRLNQSRGFIITDDRDKALQLI